ncbi:MAG: YaeQ family protein [Betaproteobacteria bacterium]|nr:YaeQ family protein [Betaproteobacteria bacterium]
MALKATIFKAELQVADMDRNYYKDHSLTLARHPSETDERLMVRLLAFALHASENLVFGRGLSTEDEPDLWEKDLTGVIKTWIDVGLPGERRVRKACGRSESVFVYAYGGRAADLWWRQSGADLARISNLSIFSLPFAATQALAGLAGRTMQLQCTIQEGQIWLGDAKSVVQIDPAILKPTNGD